jgi:UDP-N-acetylglucosamine acyltransferase
MDLMPELLPQTAMGTTIHPTAYIHPHAEIGLNVSVGPFCTIGPDVTIGDGAKLVSHVVVEGHTSIGEGVTLFPFCTVGLEPQDFKYKGEPTRCVVGARTHIREHCTIHRGTVTGKGITTIGTDCLIMAVVHVAHDCTLGNGVIIANNAVMGGHVSIADNAVIGGAAAIHQFVEIGRGAMIGGVTGVGGDVIPFGSVIGNRGHLAGLNVIGLRRRGYDKAQIQRLHVAFRSLFRQEGVFSDRLAETRERFGTDPLVAEVLAFIDLDHAPRGLIRTTPHS